MFDFIFAVYEPAMLSFLNKMPLVTQGPAEDSQRNGDPIQVSGNTAVISISGPMVKNGGWIARWLGMCSTAEVIKAVKTAISDKDIENIVLRMDTPGGSVSALAELGDAVREAAKEKNVIAQVEGMAASAGYYVASQANKIFANRMDLIGSIGTRIELYDFSKAFEKAGIEAVPVDTGEFKSAGMMGTKITDAQKADFQRIVDGFFQDFKETVMNGRNMTEKEFNSVADGRVFFAGEALDLGLIDGIQGIEQTLSELTQPAGRSTQAARRRLTI